MGGWLNKGFSGGCSLWKPKDAPLAPVEPPKPKGRSIPPPPSGKPPRVNQRAVSLVFKGQVRGGKNAVNITRSGHRYPNPLFSKWRDEMVRQVKSQFKAPMIEVDCKAYVHYYAGDHKRRDVPAVIDAIWHVLEKAGVVKDDCLIKSVDFHGSYDKENPRAEVELIPFLG